MGSLAVFLCLNALELSSTWTKFTVQKLVLPRIVVAIEFTSTNTIGWHTLKVSKSELVRIVRSFASE